LRREPLAVQAPFFRRVYALVRKVPPGRVVTYGQVALLLGVPHGARAVGWALRGLDPREEARVPWHRVVGQGGRISLRDGPGGLLQRRRLRAEGVRFVRGHVDMARHGLP
jgi:methylated-DNA-protein-cysteine methyltransferase-like protein